MSAPGKSGPTDAEKVECIRDLEGNMHDAANAAGVVWDLLEDLFEGAAIRSQDGMYMLDPGRVSRLHYAASDSWRKAEKLKDDLLAGLGYGGA